MLKYLVGPRGYLLLILSTKLYPHHKYSVKVHSTCCSSMSRAQQATCICPHTCLSATPDTAPVEKIVLSKHDLKNFDRRPSPHVDKNKTKLNDSATELDKALLFFSLSLSLSCLSHSEHAARALRRLARDAIWPAALEAAGYWARSNDDATLHSGEQSNGNLRAPWGA